MANTGSGRDSDSGGEATVLVVDDEPDMASLIANWLSPDYEVLTAGDGEAALELLSEAVDVVLLDRRMPRMDGDTFLRTMKSDGHDARVVMMTAVDPGPDIVDLPFDDYVTKPVTRDMVFEMVDRMLHLSRAGQAVREYHSLERRRDVLRMATVTSGESEPEAFDLLTRRLEAAAKDAGAGLAWLKEEYYTVEHQ